MFNNASASFFVPDGVEPSKALARCTHLGIAAHQDDLEFMAAQGIFECYSSEKKWFGGVICSNGSGSARTGAYAHITDAEMCEVRRKEQDAAAVLGRYGAMVQLGYPSAVVKQPQSEAMVADILSILTAAKPQVVYTHNPADKHGTHIGVFAATLAALRSLPKAERPARVLGCEGWRDLDWMPDDAKVALDVSGQDDLAEALNAVFDSQIAGGKRYDLAVIGRRRANATFFDSHSTDAAEMVSFAMDLTPLILDDSLDVTAYVTGFIDRFRADVTEKLGEYF